MNAPVENISKFLEGDLDSENTNALEQWRKETIENEQYFQELAYIWESSEHSLQEQTEQITIDTESALEKVNAKIGSAKVVDLKPRFNFLAIACSLALLVGAVIGFQYLNQSTQQIEIIASGEQGQEVTLPDASTIWLEPQSKVSYAPSFESGRHISIEGEVFVDVVRNEALPFTVSTPNLMVKVLGTSFVIQDTQHKTKSHVTVLSGKVNVTALETKKSVSLTKDMTVSYDADSAELNITEKSENVNHLYAGTKQLRFTEITLGELFSQLAMITNSGIELENSPIVNCPFTGQFETNQLEQILKNIQPIYNFSFKSDSGKYIISGGSCN